MKLLPKQEFYQFVETEQSFAIKVVFTTNTRLDQASLFLSQESLGLVKLNINIQAFWNFFLKKWLPKQEFSQFVETQQIFVIKAAFSTNTRLDQASIFLGQESLGLVRLNYNIQAFWYFFSRNGFRNKNFLNLLKHSKVL